MSHLIKSFLIVLGFCFATTAQAIVFNLPVNGDNVVGEITYARAQPGEDLSELGRRFDVGYYEMREANPRLDKSGVIAPWAKVVIPTQFVLPPGPRKGIVINLAELRLFYYFPDGKRVLTEPVGIGKEGWETPLGVTEVISKVKDPAWRPTERVKEDALTQGYVLPDVWPAGPDNPLGKYMMRLGWRTYLIHGTNRPKGVGKRSSAGCIRMFPEDIEKLFSLVKLGTKVRVVNKPIKIGWQNKHLFLEAHKPLKEKGRFVESDTVNLVSNIYKAAHNHRAIIKWQDVQAEMNRETGIPIVIGNSG